MISNNKKEKMKIQVSLPRLTYNNELAEKLILATKYISKQLMSFKILSTLKIKINVRKTTLGATTLGKVTSDSMVFSQKEFLIELNYKQSESEMIETIAHELVHVKQSVKKELIYKFDKELNKLFVSWKGKDLGEAGQIPYRERPYEIEAFLKEKILADMFIIPNSEKFLKPKLQELNNNESKIL